MSTTGWRKPDKKYPATEVSNQVIAEAYRRLREQNDRGATGRAAKKLGWPKWIINRHAAKLGLSHTKEAPWCDAEEQILQKFGHLSDERLAVKLRAAGYRRSVNGVHLKMKRLRIKGNLEGYSGYALALALGIDAHAISRWIEKGKLAGERRGTQRTEAQGGDTWWIKREHVKDFVCRFPEEINLHKVEKFWLFDLLTDGRICR